MKTMQTQMMSSSKRTYCSMPLVIVVVCVFLCKRITVGQELIDPKDVHQLFKLLKDFGVLRVVPKGGNQINQYLVATVLTKDELDRSKGWKEIPPSISGTDTRIKVLTNTKCKSFCEGVDEIKLHGEIQLLKDKVIPEMIKQIKDVPGKPYVCLFSHYIPCALLPKTPFSCAEELAKEALVKSDSYHMLVAFDKIYDTTDPNAAKDFMNNGGIQAFRFLPQDFESLYKLPNGNPGQVIFQTMFYECLHELPVSECCTHSDAKDRKHKDEIVALYINGIVSYCIKDQDDDGWMKGQLTRLNSIILFHRIQQYIDTNTGSDCKECPAEGVKILIKFCAANSIKFATIIGKPSNPKSPRTPTWVESGPAAVWSDLYNGYILRKTGIAIFCAIPTNDIASLCTKNGPSKENNNRLQPQLEVLRKEAEAYLARENRKREGSDVERANKKKFKRKPKRK